MQIETFVSFLIASILLTLAPGPDNLYLLAKSLKDGSKSGIILAAGLSSGIIFHTSLVMLGVATLIQNSPIAMNILKYLGAGYLTYLAIGSFRAFKKNSDLKIQTASSEKNSSTYFRGVMMNVCNPKVLLFFLAFLPSFVNLSSEDSSSQILILGITFAIQAFVIFSLISICAGKLRSIILRRKNFGRNLSLIEGIVLAIIALSLLIL